MLAVFCVPSPLPIVGYCYIPFPYVQLDLPCSTPTLSLPHAWQILPGGICSGMNLVKAIALET